MGQNPFQLGSQSSANNAQSGLSGGQVGSASFPPFGGSTNTNPSFNFAPSNSAFNFTPGSNTPFNNPFASLGSGSTGASQSSDASQGGYQGSLFNIPPQAPAAQDSKTSNTPFTFGQSNTNTSSHTQQTISNPFAQSAPTQPFSNALGKGDDQQQTSSSGIFGQIPTTPFGQAGTSQNKPASSIFSQSVQAPTNQPISSIFSTPKPQQGQAPNNIFGASTAKPGQAQSPESPKANDDSMSTTPDTSPQAPKEQAAPNPFASIHVPTSPTPQREFGKSFMGSTFLSAGSEKPDAGAPPKQGGSLFDRISQPANASSSTSEKPEDTAQLEQGGSLFDRISEPTDASTPVSKKDKQPSAPVEPPKSIFATSTKDNQDATKLFSAAPPPSQTLGNPQVDSSLSKLVPTPMQPSLNASALHAASKSVEYPPLSDVTKTTPPSNEGTLTLSDTASSDHRLQDSFDSALRNGPSFLSDEEEDQQYSLNTQWRLRTLRTGLTRLFRKVEEGTMHADSLMDYYRVRRQIIIDTADLPQQPVAGVKRKLLQEEHNLSSPKKVKALEAAPNSAASKLPVNGILANGAGSKQNDLGSNSPFKQSSHTKRKADDDIFKETDQGGLSSAKKARPEGVVSPPKQNSPAKRKADTDIDKATVEEGSNAAKRARPGDTVTYPSLSSSTGSETSNIFRSIINDEKRESSASPAKQVNGNVGSSPAKPLFGGAPVSSKVSPFANGTPQTTVGPPAESDAQSVNPFISIAPPSSTGFFSKQRSETSNSSATTASPFKSAIASPYAKPAAKTSVEKPTVQLPKFDATATANFMSQFSRAAQASEKKDKEKRKADDYDSEEDNEDDWEQKYADEQRAKKQKLEESIKGKVAKYVAGKGFVYTDSEQEQGLNKDVESDEASSKQSSRAPSISVFDQPQKPISNGVNLFSHLSDVDSGAEGSKIGDADDEDTESETSEHDVDQSAAPAPASSSQVTAQTSQGSASENPFSESATSKPVEGTKSSGPSLFDRISKDENGQVMRELPPAEDKKISDLFGISSSQKGVSSIFNNAAATTPSGNTSSKTFTGFDFSSSMATPKANVFGVSSVPTGAGPDAETGDSPGDHTWKADSPIKFGATTKAPTVKVTSPSPAKNSFGGLFGSPQTGEATETTSKPTPGIFGSTSTKGPNVGFGISFGDSAKPTPSSLFLPADEATKSSSRATSPGGSSVAESAEDAEAEGASDAPQDEPEQLDLTKGPGEEDEESLFEVKGKALTYDKEKKDWVSKGVGPLRVLKHSETGKTRVLMRQDPSGRIVLNTALLSGMEYKYVTPKSVQMPIAADTGKLATYTIRVGKDEDAQRLADILEEHKGS